MNVKAGISSMGIFSWVIVTASVFLIMQAPARSEDKILKVEFSHLAKVLLWEKSPASYSWGAVTLHTGKNVINSSERWMDLVVKMDASVHPLETTQLTVTVDGRDDGRILARKTCEPLTPDALVRLDMLSLKANSARIMAEWRGKDGILLGMGELWAMAETAKPLPEDRKIPVILDLPEGIERVNAYPVRFGLPLPRGAVWEADGLRVLDTSGREVPSQLEIAGRWAEEGSVKWMWIDAIVSGKKGDEFFVAAGKRESGSFPAVPVKVEEKQGIFSVKTGETEYLVGKDGALVKEIISGGRTVVREGGARGLYVIDQKGRIARASGKDASALIESKGPVSAVIRIEGWYSTPEGEEVARHITRLKFTAGRPEAEVVHTLILSRDTNEVWFRDIGWEFEVLHGRDTKAVFGLAGEERDYTEGHVNFPGGWIAMNPVQKKDVPAPPQSEKKFEIPLSGIGSVSMVQKEGVLLGLEPSAIQNWNRATNPTTPWTPCLHGSYSFEILKKGSGKPLYSGARMGDWAALTGASGGLMVSCRDAAAQHPKEFEVSERFLNMKLFTSSTGRELDFRMESLMKSWGMLPLDKVRFHDKVPQKLLQDYLDFISKHDSNAIGWAKTHDMMISPAISGFDSYISSMLHSKQVFMHVSPKWIRETRAMGPLHPKDPEKFPLDETLINNLFWGKILQGLGGPNGGFVDYNAGPHWIIHSWRSGSYTIRSDSWYLYARSGDRSIRHFAQGANRAFLDNNLSHWRSEGKIPGLLMGDTGSPGSLQSRNRRSDLPVYWESSSKGNYEQATVANYDQALLDYYITGSRRAGDIMKSFVEAIKEDLKPSMKHWRVILAVRHIAQAYEFSWDPRIKELIYEIVDNSIYDPESPVLLTKARPHRSSTYKMETDGDVFVELYDLFGDSLFKKMAMAIARYNWDKEAINPPKSPSQNRSTGLLGYFLWEETGNPSVASRFDYGRRRLLAERFSDVGKGEIRLTCVSQIPRYFKGLPYAMDIIERTGDDKNQKASWIAFSSETAPVRLFLRKAGEVKSPGHYASLGKNETSMNILVKKEESASVEHFKGRKEDGIMKPWTVGDSVVLKPYTVLRYIWMGHDLHTVEDRSYGVTSIDIPKDAPGGIYELEIKGKGDYSVYTNRYAPLSIYAPEGWTPMNMLPPVRDYFNVPEKTEKGRIFFEKETVLFTPEGTPFNDGKALFGWIDIPSEKTGLWSFETIDTGKVKTENLPPFFNMGSPDLYTEKE